MAVLPLHFESMIIGDLYMSKKIEFLFCAFVLFFCNTLIAEMKSIDSTLIKDYVVIKPTVAPSQSDVTYRFELCNNVEKCEVLGRATGYTAQEMNSLNGRLQRWFGAPLVFVADIVGGFALVGTGAAIVAEPLVLAGAAIGGAGGAILPGATGAVDSINPSYHWRAGGLKTQIQNQVRMLTQKEATQAYVFVSTGGDDHQQFVENLRVVREILGSFKK